MSRYSAKSWYTLTARSSLIHSLPCIWYAELVLPLEMLEPIGLGPHQLSHLEVNSKLLQGGILYIQYSRLYS